MRMPRVRLRTLMIGVGVLAVVFAVMPVAWMVFPTFRTHAGGGGKTLPLEVVVLDDATGKPIAGARVIVRNAFRPDLIAPHTDRTRPDGRVGMTIVAKSWGRLITAESEALYHVPIWRTERVSTAGGAWRCRPTDTSPRKSSCRRRRHAEG